MLKYINEIEYQKLLSIEGIPNNFNNLVIQASNYINYNTHNRIDSNNPSENVKYVTCLIVNLIEEKEKKLSEIGNLKSESVEGWSKSYATPDEIKKEYESKMYEILKMYLIHEVGIDGLPLLYSGVV